MTTDRLSDEHVARICHETNALYCDAIGDASQVSWWQAPAWQRESALDGVRFHRGHPDAGDAASHENWMAVKLADGWTHAETKDAEAQTHPCLVPFDQLPKAQQRKDALFRAIVHALSD